MLKKKKNKFVNRPKVDGQTKKINKKRELTV